MKKTEQNNAEKTKGVEGNEREKSGVMNMNEGVCVCAWSHSDGVKCA